MPLAGPFIDRCLLAIRRRESRYAKCLDRARSAQRTGNGEEPSYEDATPLRLDVHTALSQLSDDEREVCEALSHGFSIHEIATRLGCDWHTVNRRITRIRARFTELGLDGWLEAA
ncbi:MAG: ECF-type sigma factor [Pirellulaceae bacterium]|jgi:DNA-directed RNA polymerase specialized sigma24 family protein|nr:ECF-type sigma factor [Pirellulaceae bacterium]MDP6718882.1 ECF-type sigma factor [Pirellulaceae bacterium]